MPPKFPTLPDPETPMRPTRVLASTLFVTLFLFMTGCGAPVTPVPPTATALPTTDAVATETAIAAKIYATETASVPTATLTPVPTNTPPPSSTPLPTETLAPTTAPTATIAPTEVLSATLAPTVLPSATVEPTGSAPVSTTLVLTSTLSSGWIRYELPDENFALALPPTWIQVNLDTNQVQTNLEIAGEQNSKLKSMFSSQTLRQLIAAGIKLYALDSSPQSFSKGIPVSANVIKLNMGVALPLDSVVAASLNQVKNLAVASTPITPHRVKLSTTDAEVLSYATSVTTQTGDAIPATITQYIMVQGPYQYVLTLFVPSEFFKTYAPDFDKIGTSFELLK